MSRFGVHIVIGPDPPAVAPVDEYLHELSPHDPVQGHNNANRHRFHSSHLVVDIHNCHVWRDEPDSADNVVFGGTFIECRKDLVVTFGERSGTVQYHAE